MPSLLARTRGLAPRALYSVGVPCPATDRKSCAPPVLSPRVSDRLPLEVPNRVSAAAGERLYVIFPVAGTSTACFASQRAGVRPLEFARHFTGSVLLRRGDDGLSATPQVTATKKNTRLRDTIRECLDHHRGKGDWKGISPRRCDTANMVTSRLQWKRLISTPYRVIMTASHSISLCNCSTLQFPGSSGICS